MLYLSSPLARDKQDISEKWKCKIDVHNYVVYVIWAILAGSSVDISAAVRWQITPGSGGGAWRPPDPLVRRRRPLPVAVAVAFGTWWNIEWDFLCDLKKLWGAKVSQSSHISCRYEEETGHMTNKGRRKEYFLVRWRKGRIEKLTSSLHWGGWWCWWWWWWCRGGDGDDNGDGYDDGDYSIKRHQTLNYNCY